MGSDPLDETDLAGNTNNASFNEYAFFGGKRIARRDSTNAVNYYFTDHLGTARIVANSSGAPVDDSDFYPFGGERNYLNSSPQNYKFTGKERDSESGLDNFGARYFGSTTGRFMIPDWSARPAPVPFADLTNPQSLNLYSYVANNPVSRTDPLGHDWFYVDKKWQWQKGHVYHDKDGNATKDKGYAGLLVATATGTDKKTGATTYSLTLYDQDKKVFRGDAFSGGNGNAPIKDGNYMIRLDIHDPNPTTPNPNSPLHNPPPVYGIQKMDNFYFTLPNGAPAFADVTGAYGHMRARLNPWAGADQGDFLHEQLNGAATRTDACATGLTKLNSAIFFGTCRPNTFRLQLMFL